MYLYLYLYRYCFCCINLASRGGIVLSLLFKWKKGKQGKEGRQALVSEAMIKSAHIDVARSTIPIALVTLQGYH